MSAESRLREALKAAVFNPRDWYSDISGAVAVTPQSVLDWVIDELKEHELLITGGTILHVQRAWPQSGVFADAQWEVTLGGH